MNPNILDSQPQPDQNGGFITWHERPVSASMHLQEDPIESASEGCAIVVQGPLVTEKNFTLETLRLYRRLHPRASIILSTWESEDPSLLEDARKLGVEVIKCSLPSWSGQQNINLQIVTSSQGMAAARKSGAKYALKTRSDQRILSPSALGAAKQLLKEFPIEVGTRQVNRLVACSLNTFRYRLYGISDMFLFGHIDDMELYWNPPLDERRFDQGKLNFRTLREFAQWGVCEVYLATRFLESTGWNPTWTLSDYWNALSTRFCVLDRSSLDLFWPKYGSRENRWKTYRRQEFAFSEIDFLTWLGIRSHGRDFSWVDESLLDTPLDPAREDPPAPKMITSTGGEVSDIDHLECAGIWRAGTPLRLHLGCGEQHFDGYVNIDYPQPKHRIQKPKSDYQADILRLSFPDESVDEICLHHVFEHFPRVRALELLVRWHRWLKPGGKILIETPDFMGSAKRIMSDAPWWHKTAAIRHLAGDQSDAWAYHVDHWFPERFQKTMSSLGFSDIQVKSETWQHEPHLCNVTACASKRAGRDPATQRSAVEAILRESLVSASEEPLINVWMADYDSMLSQSTSLPSKSDSAVDLTNAPQAGDDQKQDLSRILDFNQLQRDAWVSAAAARIPSGSKVLDVGAGTAPYAKLFSHCEYTTHDFGKYEGEKLGGTTSYAGIAIKSDITSIPLPDASCDVILCTEVLEHVPEPIRAVHEMARILRPGGTLLLTAPLGSGLHQLPYHFYGGYTPQWYEKFLSESGFQVETIVPNGGFFKHLSQETARAANYLSNDPDFAGAISSDLVGILSETLPRLFYSLDSRKVIHEFSVGFMVEATKLGPTSKPRNVTSADGAAASVSPHTVAIVFSKDRAYQLDGMLRSLRDQVADWPTLDLKILYATSTPEHERSYQELAAGFTDWHQAEFHREIDFRSDLQRLVEGSRYVLFLVDDTVFVGPSTIQPAIDLLDDKPDVIGFSYRLGRNSLRCYTLARDQMVPSMQEIGNSVVWRWPEADADFGYPLELSSSLYRTEDILPLLRSEAYRNPNSLEDAISRNARKFAHRRPLLASLPVAKAFSIPANVVQGTHANRHGTTNAEVLLDAWRRGARMDIRSLRGTVPDAAHMELDILSASRSAGTEPLVSIVIPCYKQSEFLPECIESVVAQTYRNVEVLIVDDGSPDDTAEVAQRLIAEHPERDIRLLRKPNGGLASARNHGIAASRGDLVLPLDNDDKIHPDMVAALVELLEAHPEISIATCDYHRFGSDSGRVLVTPIGPGIVDANSMPYCSMYRRKVWETNGGYRENMRWGYEDWNFWVSSWANGFRCAKVHQSLFFYRVKPQSMVLEAQSHNDELHARIVANNRDAFPEVAQAEACDTLCSLTARSMAENDYPMALERIELALMVLPSSRTEERRTLESSVERLRSRVQAIQNQASAVPTGTVLRTLTEADRLLAGGDPQAALRLLQTIPSEQESLQIVNAKAWLLVQCGRTSEAQAEYMKATQLWPGLPETHANFAGILLQRGMPERAHDALRRVLELDPDHPDALLALARILEGDGRTEEAKSLMDRLRKSGATRPAQAIDAPEVTFVIPVKDQLPLLEKCLDSLESTHGRHAFEVVVIDDRSSGDTSRALSAWKDAGRIRLEKAPVPGNFSASCNAGARLARGRNLVFLNSDVEARPGWLDALLGALDETGVGTVGARLLYPDGRVQHAGIAFGPDGIPYHPNRGQAGDSALVIDRRDVPGVSGACLGIRARVFADAGGFDEAYPFQVEDLDLCLRIWQSGLRVVYEPASCLTHHEGGSSAGRPEKDRLFREGLSRLFTAWADRGGFPPLVQNLPGFPQMLRTTGASRPAPAPPARTATTAIPADHGSSTAGSPRVSVILPTRDRPVFLRRAMESLKAQTFRDFEVVVVDDAGCDVSAIVAEFARDGLPVRLEVHPERRGLGAARNTGIRAAHAPWIAYLDDDDLYYPDHLRLILDTLERTGAKVAYSDSMRAVEEERDGEWVVLSNELAMSNEFDRDAFLRTNLTPVNNVVHARACWEEVGGIDESLPVLEDWDFWIRLSRRWDFVHVPVATTEIRWRANGANMTFQRQGEFEPTRQRIAAKVADAIRTESSRQGLVSIVILVRDCLEITRECLESLERHTPEPHEIVLVDNGSGPETAAWLRDWTTGHPGATLIRNDDNRGFAGGNNQGIALARGRFLLLLNNDTVLTPGWLGRMVAVLDRHPDCGAVGPVSNRISGPQLDATANYSDDRGLLAHARERAAAFDGRSEEILRAVGFCLLFRREVLDRIGGLDERFGKGNFEDDDFSLRVRHAGWKSRMALDSFVHHVGGATFREQNIDYAKSLLANWSVFLRKWGLPPDLPYEGGYPFPQDPPEDALLRIPTPTPTHDHVLLGGRLYMPSGAPSHDAAPVGPGPDAESPKLTSPASEDELESLNRILFRAESAMARGDLDEADAATREAVESHPGQAMAWIARAMILRGAGKAKPALEAAERSLEIERTPEALFEEIQILRLLGRKDLAKSREKELKRDHPQWMVATRALYAQKGQAWPLDARSPAAARHSAAPPLRGK